MKTEQAQLITTREEARQFAIDWQTWQSTVSLYFSEVAEWQAVFRDLARKFGLREEFEEEGIL